MAGLASKHEQRGSTAGRRGQATEGQTQRLEHGRHLRHRPILLTAIWAPGPGGYFWPAWDVGMGIAALFIPGNVRPGNRGLSGTGDRRRDAQDAGQPQAAPRSRALRAGMGLAACTIAARRRAPRRVLIGARSLSTPGSRHCWQHFSAAATRCRYRRRREQQGEQCAADAAALVVIGDQQRLRPRRRRWSCSGPRR